MSPDFPGNEFALPAADEWRSRGGLRQSGLAELAGLESLSLEKRVTHYFEQWREQVYRYLVAVFGHPELAEEFTQEAFLRLYNVLHSGESIANVRAWVFRVAHNLAVNQIKSRQFIAPVTEEAWEELYRTLRDAAPGPEQRLLQQEKVNRLCASIARLTQAERECLHLRSKGFRYREMAEILGLSTTTVAETLYRVIGKLARDCNE
jgi:RNA polymerase sigma-70 factor (ECF subfamily)